MDIRIRPQSRSESTIPGGTTFEVTLDAQDLAELRQQAARAYEIEQALPADARTEFAGAGEETYVAEFIKRRSINDALDARNIVPVADPPATVVSSEDDKFVCRINVHPRPKTSLTSTDPVKLQTKRIAKPGMSLKEIEQEGTDLGLIDDETLLKVTMIDRLDTDLSNPGVMALGEEYQGKFERELASSASDPETFKQAHGLNDEQYKNMLADRAVNDAHWNYVLDDVFKNLGYTLTDEDLAATLEEEHPGYSAQLMELNKLRNEMWMTVEKTRRAKAWAWLKENAIK